MPSTGKRVLVVGAGPGGLSCAYHLRRMGHDVVIRDAAPEPGGMMHYGIPQYRLPRDGLMQEIARIQAMGVTIVSNYRVNDVLAEKDAGRFDAVFLAIGAQVGNHLDIPAMDGGKMIHALDLLEQVEQGQAAQAWTRRRHRRRRQHRGRCGAGREAPGRRGSGADLPLRLAST